MNTQNNNESNSNEKNLVNELQEKILMLQFENAILTTALKNYQYQIEVSNRIYLN